MAVRLKHVAQVIAGQSPESSVVTSVPEGLPFLQGSAEFGKKYPLSKNYCSTPPKIAPAGSWLISVRAPVGTLNLADQSYCIGRGLAAISPRDVDHSFLGYALESAKPFLSAISTGSTFQAISTHQLENLELDLPPPEAQRRIARFLNEKTTQIDGLLDKKRALLDRLAEKRQALIAHTVTKGLNPAAPMRPSGIDWLGDIPAHWEVLPLKRVLRSSTYGISASLEPTGEIAVLRMGNLSEGEVDFGDLRFLDEVDHDLLLEANDVVFNRTNSLDQVGKASIFRNGPAFPVSFASYLVRFRFADRYVPEYANFAMGVSGLLKLARTLALPSIGQANLNPSRYATIEFPVPPIYEQQQIAEYLVRKTSEIKAAEDRIADSAKYLGEYRAALIAASVSGRVGEFA